MSLGDQKLETMPAGTAVSLLGVDSGGLPVLTGPGIRAIRRQTFTASGTYTPDANLVVAFATVVGPGGGGGGVASSSGIGSGGGGGGGEVSEALLTPAQVGASKAVTIGTGGAGGTAGNNAGAAGSGASSIGTLITAGPGLGGGGAAANAGAAGGAGGSGGTNSKVTGEPGFSGIGQTTLTIQAAYNFGGRGGDSPYGRGGRSFSGPVTGPAGIGNGSGGGGAVDAGSGGARAGGAGKDGIVVIIEYCSA